MTALIEPQILLENGEPKFAVLPIDQYRDLVRRAEAQPTVPHAIAKRLLLEDVSPVKAWREYLALTQAEVAKRMGVSQAAFAQHEKPEAKLRKSTLEKIASALGIVPEQLDV